MEELQRYLPLLAPLLIIELVLLVIALVDLIRRQEVKYYQNGDGRSSFS